MKFTVHNNIHSLGRLEYSPDDYSATMPKAKLEVSVSSGYVELLTAEEWDTYQALLNERYNTFRNELIEVFISGWGTMTTVDKKALVRHFVWPAGTPGSELNTLYSTSERGAYRREVMRALTTRECLPRKSATAGSTKYFDITIDDSGVLNPQEITSYGTM